MTVLKKSQNGKLYRHTSNLYQMHSTVADGMLSNFDMPKFVNLRWIAMRKQVQISFFSNSLSAWDEMTYTTYGKHSLLDYRQLIVKTMKAAYLPQIEDYYNCKILNFYLLEPCFTESKIYGFTAKVFAASLFKSIDPWHAPLEEKLASALATYIRQQYGRGPGQTSVALIDNRVLVFMVTDLLSDFQKNFAETDTVAMNVTTKMLKNLFVEAIEVVCREQYRKTYESFFEINIVENQLLALILIEPLTEEDMSLN